MLIGISGRRQFGEKHWQELSGMGYECLWVQKAADLEGLDGLILSGLDSRDWPGLAQLINALRAPVWRQRPLLADGWGCHLLAKNQSALMDCSLSSRLSGRYSAELVLAPSWETERLVAVFAGEMIFSDIAPNIAVLAHNKRRGAVLLRQGNTLACGFLTACTKNKEIYRYFGRMLERGI